MKDGALLGLRLVLGGLLAGHGAQKLFGWFGGGGRAGTEKMLGALGISPPAAWAPVVAATELGGGLLTILGLASPAGPIAIMAPMAGPIAIMAPMAVATGRAHWGKPIWASKGGPELPITNIAIGGTLAILGPGRASLDRMLGVRMPLRLTVALAGATGAGVAYVLTRRPAPATTTMSAPAAAEQHRQPTPS
ncbi:MAG: DoxX family membrane protein [Candidatus Dormibacteraceae bacterium]